MGLTATTLTNPITDRDDTILVAAVTGAAEGGIVKLNDEYAFIVSVDTTAKTLKLRSRGSFGTSAKAHAASTPVIFGALGDMPLDPGPGQSFAKNPQEPEIVTLTTTGSLTPPTRDTTVHLIGAAAITTTLTSPSLAADGVRVTFLTGSAHAHVINYADQFLGAATSDVATFAANVGNSLTVVAQAGKWRVESQVGVTFS
jgi:hypothetical protein